MNERAHLATQIRPVDGPDDGPPARLRRLRMAIEPPMLGGLLGGTAVGLLESLQILRAAYGTQDYSGLVFAVLIYGAFGAAMGAGLGVLSAARAALVGEPPGAAPGWTAGFLAVVCSLGPVITIFVVRRDVFGEEALSDGVRIGIFAAYAVFALVFWIVVRNALAKTFFSFLLRPLGTLSTYGGILGFTLLLGVGTMLDRREVEDIAARPVAPELEERPNLLLVVVDTLRADALGTYGAPGDPSPATDVFAEGTVVFEQASASASWTRPSFASLYTATHPCTHQTFRKSDVLPSELTTIAEALQSQGYTTGAIVNNINVTGMFQFQQGFDTYRFLKPAYPLRAGETAFRLTLYSALRVVYERWLAPGKKVERYYAEAGQVNEESKDWLRRHGRSRWFLVVHYMDPHDPYFAHPYDGTAVARVETPRPDPEDTEKLRQLYDGEVRYWDQHFGELLEWLGAEGLMANTAVVLTSDHGEEFNEHGGFWHGNRLYEEQIRVPLVVRYPEGMGPAGTRSSDVVRLIDVAPTLTELAGAQPGPRWQGVSLRREYELREERDRLALSEADFEGFRLAAVRDRDWKLIHNDRIREGAAPRPARELFFLRADAGEQQDLASDPAAAWALERADQQLRGLQAMSCGVAVDRTEMDRPLSAADCEALRSLGYTDASGRCE